MFLGLPSPDPFRCTDPDLSIMKQKILRKTFILTVLWLLFDFLSLKNDVNVLAKREEQKTILCTEQQLMLWAIASACFYQCLVSRSIWLFNFLGRPDPDPTFSVQIRIRLQLKGVERTDINASKLNFMFTWKNLLNLQTQVYPYSVVMSERLIYL